MCLHGRRARVRCKRVIMFHANEEKARSGGASPGDESAERRKERLHLSAYCASTKRNLCRGVRASFELHLDLAKEWVGSNASSVRGIR